MSENTPAAATPAVLPLSAERQTHVLHVGATRGDVDYCDACFDEWPCQVALLGMLDAARADLAEFARQTREAQASLLAAILDKEQEREWRLRDIAQCRADEADVVRLWKETEAALQAERNRRKWAETRASHWRRQEDLVMIRLAQRSNELGRANLAHRTALAQERQAREQVEKERDHWKGLFQGSQFQLHDTTRYWEQERARGERLAEALASLVAVADAYVQDFEDGDKQDALFECLQKAATVLLAAPASPAAEPAE
jgi:hypothetical protein